MDKIEKILNRPTLFAVPPAHKLRELINESKEFCKKCEPGEACNNCGTQFIIKMSDGMVR